MLYMSLSVLNTRNNALAQARYVINLYAWMSFAEATSTIRTWLDLVVFVPLSWAFRFNRQCVYKIAIQFFFNDVVDQTMSLQIKTKDQQNS